MGATESLDGGSGRAGGKFEIEPWMPPHDMISNIQARRKSINRDVQGPLRPSMRLLLSFPKVFFTAQRFKLTLEASGGFGCAKHRQAQTAACRER